MLPFAEKRRSFSRRGPWSYRPFEVVHHTPMICNMQDSFLWNRMTSYGHRDPYIPLGAVSIGNSREWLTLKRAVNSNYATSSEENTSKVSPEDATSTTEDIQLGDVEPRLPTGGPCMYGFRASILLPHLSSSRPDTYLNHHGRTTDPFWKKTFFFQQKVTFFQIFLILFLYIIF